MPGLVNEMMLEGIKNELGKGPTLALVRFNKVTVRELQDFQKNLKAHGSWYVVMKNRVLALALKEKGLQVPDDFYDGPTLAVLTDQDVTAFAKTLVDFSKKAADVKIKGGIVKNQIISAEDLIAISQLPSRDVLISKVLGSMLAPVSRFACVLNAIITSLLYALKAIEEKKNIKSKDIKKKEEETS